MRIRIAQKAVKGSRPATVLTDDTVAVRTAWVEIGGKRYPEILSATVETGDNGVQITTLRLISTAEFVYLDEAGDPIEEVIGS